MSRAGSAKGKHPGGWEAQTSASQPTPLAIVASAVVGDGIERVARSASEALGHPVAIILPSPAAPVVWPADAIPAERRDELIAAAAAVTRLMQGEATGYPRELVETLIAGPPPDVNGLVTQGRALGFDLGAGAIAVCGRGGGAVEGLGDGGALVASPSAGGVVALVPLADEGLAERQAAALAGLFRGAGFEVGVSGPRRQPALLHEAVREAMLLAELAGTPDAAFAAQEETYRLLIGVLLRDRHEVELLREHTISPLLAYDAEHDTELLGTLGTFLAHHGSTTETAEAMRLHRHTVGYRLSRVQEVSGLSPYESDGRERLSLGLKAAQILAADERLSQPG
jgi:PucR C-terminal helix-turn-helix domain/GGDEF-like domain